MRLENLPSFILLINSLRSAASFDFSGSKLPFFFLGGPDFISARKFI